MDRKYMTKLTKVLNYVAELDGRNGRWHPNEDSCTTNGFGNIRVVMEGQPVPEPYYLLNTPKPTNNTTMYYMEELFRAWPNLSQDTGQDTGQ